MSLTLAVKTLLPALQTAKGFVAERDIVPAYRHLYVDGDGLRAFTGVAGCHVPGFWKATDIGEPFSVPAAPFLAVVQSLAAQGVDTLTISPVTNGKVTLKGGRFKSTVPVLPTEQYQGFRFPDRPTKPLATPLEFWADLKRALWCVSRTNAMPQLRAVYWSPTGEILASDNVRIVRVRPGPSRALACPLKEGVGLPDYLLDRMDLGTVRAIHVTDTLCWLLGEGSAAFGPLYTAPFPAEGVARILTEAMARRKTATMVTLDPDVALDAVTTRLEAFLGLERELEISVETKSVTLRAVAGDAAASAEETLPAVIKGKPVTVRVDGSAFLEALRETGRTCWVPAEGAIEIAGQAETKKDETPAWEMNTLLVPFVKKTQG